MEQFQAKFIEEATDLIDELEELMLASTESTLPKSLIEQVFRTMHTLKGSGAMFGFQSISGFAHHLEDLYDSIRSGRVKVSDLIVELTLTSVDVFKELLVTGNVIGSNLQQKIDRINLQILRFLEQTDTIQFASSAKTANTDGVYWWIEFCPSPNIFDNGTNPLYILDELVSMGKSIILADTTKLHGIADYNPASCYTQWFIGIFTKAKREELDEVFLFVEDTSNITITQIADFDITEIKEISDYLHKAKSESGTIYKSLRLKLEQLIQNTRDVLPQPEVTPGAEIRKQGGLNSIRVASDKIDDYLRYVSELVTVQTSLTILADKLKDEELTRISEEVEHLARNLRDNAISVSLVPFATIVNRFQRLVHDLSREFNKGIELRAEGTDTELDKTMIQTITDPLMHILRNSIDHGIEDSEERERKGKPTKGTITMRAFHSGASIIIEVEDDGKGIDPEKVKQTAIKKGLVLPTANLTNDDVLRLILMPGFSTAEKTTTVSGRGVGMDVVHQNVQMLKGTISVRSKLDCGTTIRIKLPQSLSILDGMLTKLGDKLFIIPSTVLSKIIPIEASVVMGIRTGVLKLDSMHLPYLNLRKEFDIKMPYPARLEVIVLEYDDKKIGLIVDQVQNEYQVVLRPLGKFLKDSEMLLGAAIIGEGNIALVLDTDRIIKRVISENTAKTNLDAR
ncbi:MAG: hypothetical protein RIS47_742 [Bacteroidota bacterium]